MTLYYLDSSAWVKRYLAESGSQWVRDLFERKEPFACCALGYTEVSAALARQVGVQQISPFRKEKLKAHLLADWNEMLQLPVDGDVLRRAADLAWEHKLRSADAIHLAVAYWLNDSLLRRFVSLVLVTADAELLQAAQGLHIVVANPNEFA